MKLKCTLLHLLLFCTLLLRAQLPLNGSWSYTFKDDSANASSSLNVSDWKTAESNKLRWEKADLPKDGNIIWIRKTIVIPASLKAGLNKTGALMLSLGRIIYCPPADKITCAKAVLPLPGCS